MLFKLDAKLVSTDLVVRTVLSSVEGRLKVSVVKVYKEAGIRQTNIFGKSTVSRCTSAMDSADLLFFKSALLPGHDVSTYRDDFPMVKVMREVFNSAVDLFNGNIEIDDTELNLSLDVVVNSKSGKATVRNLSFGRAVKPLDLALLHDQRIDCFNTLFKMTNTEKVSNELEMKLWLEQRFIDIYNTN